MKKGDEINGYTLTTNFTTAGGGQCQWAFAIKGGKEYFIKEFLSHVYPIAGAPGSPATKAKMKEECEKFQRHHEKLKDVFSRKCGEGGFLIATRDFFLYKTRYYKVNEKVDVSSTTISDISDLTLKKKIILLKTIAISVQLLHRENIVHGDLKPDNILIKETKPGFFTAKLIDFDNSYFSGDPLAVFDDVVGDDRYYSPELASFIQKDKSIKPSMLQIKSDIFSLGVIFYQYLTGNLPFKGKYKSPYIAVLDNAKVTLPDELPHRLNQLIENMLNKDTDIRPDINEVYSELDDISEDPFKPTKITKEKKPEIISKLRGDLLKSIETDGKPKSTSKLRGDLLR